MAAQIPVLEAADKKADASKGKGRLFLIIVGSVAAVLIAGGGGAAWWLSNARHPAAPAAAPVEVHPAGPPLFVGLDPPFVVNFDSGQAVRFLQIAVQLETRDPATVELLKTNDPVVRNDLLMLFGTQTYAQLATREGKEGLRRQALDDVRKVLQTAGGHPERLEAVYFTSFVMQ